TRRAPAIRSTRRSSTAGWKATASTRSWRTPAPRGRSRRRSRAATRASRPGPRPSDSSGAGSVHRDEGTPMMHLAAVVLCAVAQQSQIPEIGFEPAFEKIKIERCVVIAHPPDGTDRIFVVEQPGRVKWFENKPDASEMTLALDLTSKVLSTGNEEGMLGLAFHPQFKTNHQVFIQYSFPKLGPKQGDKRKRYPDTRNVLSRFEMDPEHR